MRLVVLAGSLNERDDQRGIAHFLEHLAFDGSSHFPPGALVEFLQRMGMAVGADVNANTGFDRTVYRLELPRADDAILAEGLRVFGDDAQGLLLARAGRQGAADHPRGKACRRLGGLPRFSRSIRRHPRHHDISATPRNR